MSEADRQAEEFLYRSVCDRFPDHSVIGEEGQDPGPDRAPIVWVVDPLDGTSNYLHGLSLWCVSIGVLWYGVPIAGAIYAPLGPDGHAALFTSRKGGGTRLNGHEVSVDPEPSMIGSRLEPLPEVYQAEIGKRREYRGSSAGEVRTLGSIALELALTACGVLRFSAFWFPRIWDIAAGASLVMEADGRVMRREPRGQVWSPLTNFDVPSGQGLRKWQGSVIAANSRLATDIAERVKGGRDPYAPARSS